MTIGPIRVIMTLILSSLSLLALVGATLPPGQDDSSLGLFNEARNEMPETSDDPAVIRQRMVRINEYRHHR